MVLLGFGSAGYASGNSHSAGKSAKASSCTDKVTTSGAFTVGAGSASVTFSVASGCAQVSLVSYTMPGATYDPATANQQVIFDARTVDAEPGAPPLTVRLPSCYYQLDFVYGTPITTLGPLGTSNFYGTQGRLIISITGGSSPCSTTTTTATTTGTTTTATTTTTGTTTTGETTTAATTTGATTTGATTTGATTTGATTTTAATTTVATTTASPTVTGTTTETAAPTTSAAATTATGVTTTTGATTTTAATTTTTTAPATTDTTTTGPFVPPPQTTTNASGNVPGGGGGSNGGGPFTPPPSAPTQGGGTSLPFTGAPLSFIVGIGLALLLAGALIELAGRHGLPALDSGALAQPPLRRSLLHRRRAPSSDSASGDYSVVVPGVGTFPSVDEAERQRLDLRWARAGSPTLGAPGTRRDD